MKFVTFAAAPAGEAPETFQAWFVDDYARDFAAANDLATAIVRQSVMPPGAAPQGRGDQADPAHLPFHAILEVWLPTAEDFRRIASVTERSLRSRGVRYVSYRVTPSLEKDPRFAEAGTGGARPGITYVTPVRWLPGLSPAEARRHWDEHVPAALRVHASMSKYERNWVDEVMSWSADAVPVDAYADFSFAGVDEWDRFFPDDAARLEISQDIASFIHSGSGLFLGDAEGVRR